MAAPLSAYLLTHEFCFTLKVHLWDSDTFVILRQEQRKENENFKKDPSHFL